MGYTENLCMNCFEPLTAGCICRNCGFDNDSVTDTLFLPRRTILAKRYIVGNAISVENDSVEYVIVLRVIMMFMSEKDTERILQVIRNLSLSYGERLRG